MTDENQQAIDDAPQMEAVADNDSVETDELQDDEGTQTDAPETEGNDSDDVEFPKKAVNALNRKNKQINKLRAELQALKAKQAEVPRTPEPKRINPDDYDTMEQYLNDLADAKAESRLQQSQADMQKQQLTEQQAALEAQRLKYVEEQAHEVAQTLTDLPQLWNQNAKVLDSLPAAVEDIFYSIDNPVAAVYVLAKEGKLESLLYANPTVAAYEIINAQNKGMELLSKPQTRQSQAPQPISKARGTGTPSKSIKQMSGKELLDRFAK